ILSTEMDTLKAAKATSNWITGAVFSISNDNKIEINEDNIPKQSLAYLILEYEKKILTRNKAEELLRESLEQKKDLKILIENATKESQDSTSNIESIVDEVINTNPKAVNDFKSGKESTIGFLVGQVMQRTKGNANPNIAKSVLIKKLNG
ncbi:MAG: Aspartyl/glutamyl-tRNA(Asn/Gln) amidotransferase subunit B, partial [candidate division WS6 bacterium GW2011_GWB1_33_6]